MNVLSNRGIRLNWTESRKSHILDVYGSTLHMNITDSFNCHFPTELGIKVPRIGTLSSLL